jgi:hypothetical protein
MENLKRTVVRSLGVASACLLTLSACGGDAGDVVATNTEAPAAAADGHEHDHSETEEWIGSAPVIHVTPAEAEGAVALDVDVEGFRLSNLDGTGGDGHLHVTVDGELAGMFFEERVLLTGVTEGTHRVDIALNSNDHLAFVADGETVGAAFMLTIHEDGSVHVEHGAEDTADMSHDDEGHDDEEGHEQHDDEEGHEQHDDEEGHAEADVTLEVAIEDGAPVGGSAEVDIEHGSVVALMVTSDAMQDIHVHGYELLATVHPDEPLVLTFEADIPGVFEVEIEGSGRLVFELRIS